MQGAIAKEILMPNVLSKNNSKKIESKFEMLSIELNEVKKDINRVYCGFNIQTDADMIDSYIFELMALESKQRFLIRQLKEMHK
jgi:hypothetical protein